MARINRCIELLEIGQPVYYDRVGVTDLGYEAGRDLSGTWADYLRIEFEHQALDGIALYDFMRGLRDAGPTRSGHLTPAVLCTLPATGMTEAEVRVNAWQIRQILTAGVHGLYLSRVQDARAVRAFVEAVRFPHQTIGVGASLGRGNRGHGGEERAAGIWGLDRIEYMRRADPWPLNPEGELMLGIKVEDPVGFDQADLAMATPGVTFGEWGPGDMGMSLGHPEWKDPPYSTSMENAWRTVKRACDKAGVAWLCTWDDPGMTSDERVKHLIQEIGATLMAATEGEIMASAGRKLTNRKMPV